jgi:diaminohydroxyphosphoribosylaminopyrimidine deaminase/5-amino-6-(5-phosphoribosylamino)uracil reductase
VVVGCPDPFDLVAGKGIQKMREADIAVQISPLVKEAEELNKRFFTFHQKRRPYTILKWAQSSNAKIAAGESPLRISNQHTNRVVHKWRGEEQAIMVGTNTALLDNPSLTTRLYPGNHPRRIVLDRSLRLPAGLSLFDGSAETVVLNSLRHEVTGNITYFKLTEKASLIESIQAALYDLRTQSVLVEGGAQLLQSFIDAGAWDEARIITNNDLVIDGGVHSPVLSSGILHQGSQLQNDSIHIFRNPNP